MRPIPCKSYRRIAAALLLIVGFLAAWRAFVLLTPPPEHQTVRLEDGRVVEMLGYSFGKKHELRVRKPVQNLGDFLALFRQAPLIRAVDTDRDALLLWVRIPSQIQTTRVPSTDTYLAYAKGANGYSYPSSMVNYVPVKYHVGIPFNTFQMLRLSGGGFKLQQEEVVAIPLTCYPQRESRFTVDLAQYGGRQALGTFHITNPNPARPASFTADPLPATRREKDLKVTLDSITPVPGRTYVLPDGSTVLRSEARAPKEGIPLLGEEGRQQVTLSYSYQGQPTLSWKITELTAFDAMGNRTQEIAPTPRWSCRKYVPPSSGEPYKIKVGIQKTWGSLYEADERWIVNDLPLPTQGKPMPINMDLSRDGLHLKVVRVYGMGGKNFSPDLALIQIKVEADVANPVLFIHAEDEQGRTIVGPWTDINNQFGPSLTFVEQGNISQMHNGIIGDNDANYRTVPLKIPHGVKRLKLVITAPRTHFFEFVVPPYQHSQK